MQQKLSQTAFRAVGPVGQAGLPLAVHSSKKALEEQQIDAKELIARQAQEMADSEKQREAQQEQDERAWREQVAARNAELSAQKVQLEAEAAEERAKIVRR